MKFYILLGLIYGLIIATRAVVMRGTYKDPRYPNKCVIGELIVSPGEEAKNPFSRCGRVLCGKDGAAVFHTCGAILPPDGHKLGEPINPTAPYPHCCEKHYIPVN